MQPTRRTDPYWRDSPRGMVLVATRTAGIAAAQFPPAEFLVEGVTLEEVELGPEGVLYSFTVVHAGKDQPPYALAMVDFKEGVRAFGRLVDYPAATIGSNVRVVPFALPDNTPDYAFSPI